MPLARRAALPVGARLVLALTRGLQLTLIPLALVIARALGARIAKREVHVAWLALAQALSAAAAAGAVLEERSRPARAVLRPDVTLVAHGGTLGALDALSSRAITFAALLKFVEEVAVARLPPGVALVANQGRVSGGQTGSILAATSAALLEEV